MKTKKELLPCPVAITLQIIGTRWKILVLKPLIEDMAKWGEYYKNL